MPSDRRLILTAEAESDLADSWQYVAETWVEEQAESYTELILSRLDHLTRFPFLGRSRREISPELRGLDVGQHVAFYRVQDEDVIVRRLFHSRQDVGEAFSDE